MAEQDPASHEPGSPLPTGGGPLVPRGGGTREAAAPDAVAPDEAPAPGVRPDPLLALAENLRWLSALPVLAAIVVFVVATLLPARYTAQTRILPPSGSGGTAGVLASALGPLGGLAGSLGALPRTPAEQVAGLLRSRSLADRIVERFDLRARYRTRTTDGARAVLEKRVLVTTLPKEGQVTVAFTDRDPRIAAQIANAWIEELRGVMRTIAITEAGQRRLFFEQRVRETREALVAAEHALKGTGVAETAIKLAPQAVLEQAARLKAQIAAQEIRVASMRGYLGDDNAFLRQALHELGSMRSQWDALRRSQPGVDGTDDLYAARYRDFKYQEALFELMARQYEAARLDEAREGSVVQVIDEAVPPQSPSGLPPLLLAIAAALGAGVLGVGFVLLRQAALDALPPGEAEARRRRRRDALRRAFGRQPA